MMPNVTEQEAAEMRVLLAMASGSLWMAAELLERGVLPPGAGGGKGTYQHVRMLAVRCAELSQLKIAPEVVKAMREGLSDA